MAPPRGHGRGLVLILGGLVAFGPLSIDMYLPAFPDLTGDLGVSASEVQFTLTACLIGLALGQLVAGPISDTRGRRLPLAIGLGLYVLASIGCALATNIWMLAALRFIQGLAGAAGIVISRAIARDLFSGTDLARFFATLMLVNGLAPILAPIIGSSVLEVTDWRGVFLVLAGFGALLLLASGLGLSETLPQQSRRSGGIGATLRTFASLLRDTNLLGYVLTGGLAMAAMFAYISGSPFVLQDVYGLSHQMFSLCFGLNAIGIVAASQVSGRLAHRIDPRRLLTIGIAGQFAGAITLAVAVFTNAGLWLLLPGLFLVVANVGFIGPNATALALSDHGRVAGSAAALVGVAQFIFGAAVAPLVGIAGSATAVPLGLVILTVSALAVVSLVLATRHQRRTT